MHPHVAVARRIRSILSTSMWEGVPDPRCPHRINYSLAQLLQLVVLGLASGAQTFRDVERLGQTIKHRRALGLKGTPSDSRLYEVLRGLRPDDVHTALDAMIVQMHRAKQLTVDPKLGVSLVAIDGKRVGNGRASFHDFCVKGGKEGGEYYQLLVLRAVHVGSAVKPVLAQRPVGEGQGEQVHFKPLVEQLLERHPTLVECLSVDAAYTTMTNMEWLHAQGVDYIAALKGNQEILHRRALQLLGAGDPPAGGWEAHTEEWTGNRRVQRSFARTAGMNDYHGWKGLYTEVWRVQSVTTKWDGTRTTEDRYFLTSLPPDRLTSDQKLHAVRAHWGIENDHHWTVDMVLGEDDPPWIRKDKGAEVLALLRCMAYNLLRLLRCRSLRSEANRKMPWRALIERVRDSLVANLPLRDSIWEPDGIG